MIVTHTARQIANSKSKITANQQLNRHVLLNENSTNTEPSPKIVRQCRYHKSHKTKQMIPSTRWHEILHRQYIRQLERSNESIRQTSTNMADTSWLQVTTTPTTASQMLQRTLNNSEMENDQIQKWTNCSNIESMQ